MTRSERCTEFLNSAGWGLAKITPLAGDASNRCYHRLTKPDGTTVVLMDAPPEKNKSTLSFVHIAEHLIGLGLSAPEILHQDIEAGFLVIEDLGDRLFARELVDDPTGEGPLYRVAADVLTRLHDATVPDLEPYDSDITVPLATLSYDWYQLGAQDSIDVSARNLLAERLKTVLAPFDHDLTVLIQRDYHAENLLWLPDRNGVARVGLLDFQDAMLGHPAYDLVSVLQDARRTVSETTVQQTKKYFVYQNRHDPDRFEAAYAAFGLQRNLRILGVFARLCMRDGKAHYVDLMPRVWRHVQTNLKHRALRDIAPLIAHDLPAPTAEVCARLKEKCGKWAGR